MSIEWETSEHLVNYETAMARMEQRVADIHDGTAPELVWLLEHPPLYTAGTSAKTSDLLQPKFPVFQTGRGGQYTYHGPGQRIAYVMMDLRRQASGIRHQASEPSPIASDRSHEQGQLGRPAGRPSHEPSPIASDRSHEQGQLHNLPDLRRYVQQLEEWIILTLAEFGVRGELREGRVGVWVVEDQASGVRHQAPVSSPIANDRSHEQGQSGRPAGRPSPEPSPIANDRSHEQGQSGRPAGRPSHEPSPIANDRSHEQGQKKESKIAALGIRVRRGVAFHGIALNVNPDLSHYAGIVPCGIREHGVTSLHALGVDASMHEVDAALKRCFGKVFSNR